MAGPVNASGRSAKHDLRAMADAVSYVVKNGVDRYFMGAQNTRIRTANVLIGIHPAPAQQLDDMHRAVLS